MGAQGFFNLDVTPVLASGLRGASLGSVEALQLQVPPGPSPRPFALPAAAPRALSPQLLSRARAGRPPSVPPFPPLHTSTDGAGCLSGSSPL